MIQTGNIYAGLGGGSSGGVTTLDNGLTLTGTNGQLGGVIIQNTAIDVQPSFTFFIGDVTTLTAYIDWVTGGAPSIEIGITKSGPVKQTLLMDAVAGIEVTDSANSKGLVGAADYSAGPTASNLAYIQKLYADAHYAGLGNVVLLTTDQTIHGTKTFTGAVGDGLFFEGGFQIPAGTGSAIFTPIIVASRSAAAYIDSAGVLRTTSNILYNSSKTSIGGQNPANFSDAVFLIFADASARAVQMQVLTQAERLALNLTFSDATGALCYQTDGTPGMYELTANNVSAWRRLLNTDDLPAFNSPAIVATDKVAGESASANLITFAVPAGTSRSYRLNLATVLRNVTVGTVTGSYAYTDSAGNAASGNFFNQGATVAAISTLNNSTFPPVVIYANPGTNITIDQAITGTILADFAASVELLN